MSNPTNWPIVTDAESYFRHNEKRLLHEQRRPVVGHGNIIGPGISPNANQVDDWNDDVCATNGYFWSEFEAPNAPNGFPPPEGFGIPVRQDGVWLGHVVSMGDRGYQTVRLMPVQNEWYLDNDPEDPGPEIILDRTWWVMESGRVYTKWRWGAPNQPVKVYDTTGPVTALTGSNTYHGGQDDPGYEENTDLYIPSVNSIFLCTATVEIVNTVDTAGSYRELRFWPSLFHDHTPIKLGKWSHYGRGDVGFSETETATFTTHLPHGGTPLANSGLFVTPQLGVRAVGANIQIESFEVTVTQVQ